MELERSTKSLGFVVTDAPDVKMTRIAIRQGDEVLVKDSEYGKIVEELKRLSARKLGVIREWLALPEQESTTQADLMCSIIDAFKQRHRPEFSYHIIKRLLEMYENFELHQPDEFANLSSENAHAFREAVESLKMCADAIRLRQAPSAKNKVSGEAQRVAQMAKKKREREESKTIASRATKMAKQPPMEGLPNAKALAVKVHVSLDEEKKTLGIAWSGADVDVVATLRLMSFALLCHAPVTASRKQPLTILAAWRDPAHFLGQVKSIKDVDRDKLMKCVLVFLPKQASAERPPILLEIHIGFTSKTTRTETIQTGQHTPKYNAVCSRLAQGDATEDSKVASRYDMTRYLKSLPCSPEFLSLGTPGWAKMHARFEQAVGDVNKVVLNEIAKRPEVEIV